MRKSHQVQRLALTTVDAAEALGGSRDFFDKRIAPELRWVRRGRLKFVAIPEPAKPARCQGAQMQNLMRVRVPGWLKTHRNGETVLPCFCRAQHSP